MPNLYNYGHGEENCWLKHPHLKPRWMVEKEEWRRQKIPSNRNQSQHTQVSNALIPANAQLTHIEPYPRTNNIPTYQTAYQNPSFLSGPPPHQSLHQAQLHTTQPTLMNDGSIFMGPGSTNTDNHQIAGFTSALRGKDSFGNEFAYSVESKRGDIINEGGVNPGDEPGKCPPVKILTGNGWVYAYFYGTIPLILSVENERKHTNLDNVLYVPSLQTKVNLFSVPILTDKGLHCDLGPIDCKFTLDGKLLASGTKIGNSWWLDADVRVFKHGINFWDT
ncbi:hypothetical protein L211DRAFT_848713 [Terfezia boudieri ATCC MYA-4762]|uniref:Uncharacterized protein n=1 Tax=Terfezia boudieri ATCC MYA-4762 TaxID=1051890 RepID=A0A3N4LPZ7_9PEZI|nr:hypothetical protein L211DRAFT_848713 [Terfezia boudieri ATCC MYA-4762]